MVTKSNSNFIIISIKKNIIPMIFILFTICLVIFSKQNLSATHEGLLLCANSVVPSLFPFFIATELLSHTNIVATLGKMLNKIMRPIFNVPGEGAYAFIMGIISGYPVGAKIVTKFREDGICNKAEAERLLAFTNNSGPLFIIGTVGISLFGNTTIGILLFITHLLACISVGFLFRFWRKNDPTVNSYFSRHTTSSTHAKPVQINNLGEILTSSISNAISSVVLIGGFVVLFSVVLSILNSSGFFNICEILLQPFFNFLHIDSSYITPFISGIIELTNGVKDICNIQNKAISVNIVFCAFLLGFGGFSILLQVFSIVSISDISIKAYLVGKLLQGSLAALYTHVIIKYIDYFNFDIAPVFSINASKLNTNLISSYYSNYNICIVLLIIVFSIFAILFKKRKCK